MSAAEERNHQVIAILRRIRGLSVPAGEDWGHSEIAELSKEALALLETTVEDSEARLRALRVHYFVRPGRQTTVGASEAGLRAALEYTTAEKHVAQADAEREKNVADTLRLELAEARKYVDEVFRLRRLTENQARALDHWRRLSDVDSARIRELEAKLAGIGKGSENSEKP